MKKVTVSEAKAQLSALIEAVLAGEDVTITRRDIPVSRLVAAHGDRCKPRFGVLAGQVQLADDFDAPLGDFDPYRG